MLKKEKHGTNFTIKGMNVVSTKTAKYTYKQMEKDLKKLKSKYNYIFSYNSLGKTQDNRNIYSVIIGNSNAKKQIVVQATMHAREYINSLLAMRQIEAICANFYTGTYNGKYYSEIFDNICLHIIPMTNPDGVTISQYGAKGINNKTLRKNIEKMCKKYGKSKTSYYTRWKANGRGVDLNRNYPLNFDKFKCIKSARSEGYKGKTAGSENETKILLKLINDVKPVTVISYHSTGSIIYWNFNQKSTLQKKCKSLFNVVKKLTKYVDAEPNKSKKAKLGPYFSDWLCDKKKIPALTIETGRGICPIKKSEFDTIWKKNRYVIPAVVLWVKSN